MIDHQLDKAVQLIKEFEGFEYRAYQDPVGIWTIGYGSTTFQGQKVRKGLQITEQQATEQLYTDLQQALKTIQTYVKVPINNNQLCALIDFVYNCGSGNFMESTLLKKLNVQDYKGASEQFLVWVKSKGKVLPGLIRRRQAEKDLFDTPV